MNKPKLKLVGENGNAFSILGRAQSAARKASWTKKRIKEFMDKAMSGDYDNFLATCMDYFDCDSEGEDLEEDEECPDCGEIGCDGGCVDEEDDK